MKPTICIEKNTIREHLVDMLPYDQRYYAGTKAYIALCDALWNYLQSDYDSKEEKRQVLQHAKAVFEDMCERIPDPIIQEDTWEQKLQRMMQ